MEPWVYVLAIVGGFVAGFINTLAGNGSAITLTIMMEFMGVPPTVANCSNRLGVIGQTSVSSFVFAREGKIIWKKDWKIFLFIFLGAMPGLYLAITIGNEWFRNIYGVMMIIMLGVILVNPKRWINPQEGKNPPSYVLIPLYLVLGFYGGFLQMGMGVIFLAVVVLVAGYDIIRANATKTLAVFLYTVVALAIFSYQGLVDWKAGGLIAIGQILGGLVCSKFAATHPKAGVVAHRLLVAIVIFAIAKVFIF